MMGGKALLDYEKFRPAKVVVFVDCTDAGRSFELLTRQREKIGEIVDLFAAELLLVEEKKLLVERVVEEELADAWILLVSDGRNRVQATKNNPHRINVDARSEWVPYAYREILRQVRESTAILEDVTAYYGRFGQEAKRGAQAVPPSRH